MRVSVLGEGQLARCLRVVLAGHHSLVEVERAEVAWAAEDTGVDATGRADLGALRTALFAILPKLRDGALVVVSSQVPPGFTAGLRGACRAEGVEFCYLLENIKADSGAPGWHAQRAFIVGTFGGTRVQGLVRRLLEPFPQPVLFMHTASAELAKTAINGWLATSIAFVNEVADAAAGCGADSGEVERAMRADVRISQAPVRAGAPFTNEHLGRDLRYLTELAKVDLPVIRTVYQSNLVRLAKRGNL